MLFFFFNYFIELTNHIFQEGNKALFRCCPIDFDVSLDFLSEYNKC